MLCDNQIILLTMFVDFFAMQEVSSLNTVDRYVMGLYLLGVCVSGPLDKRYVNLLVKKLGTRLVCEYLELMKNILSEECLKKRATLILIKNKLLEWTKSILKSQFSAINKLISIDTYAITIVTYRFGIMKWSSTDLYDLNRAVRTLLTNHPRKILFATRARGTMHNIPEGIVSKPTWKSESRQKLNTTQRRL